MWTLPLETVLDEYMSSIKVRMDNSVKKESNVK